MIRPQDRYLHMLLNTRGQCDLSTYHQIVAFSTMQMVSAKYLKAKIIIQCMYRRLSFSSIRMQQDPKGGS